MMLNLESNIAEDALVTVTTETNDIEPLSDGQKTAQFIAFLKGLGSVRLTALVAALVAAIASVVMVFVNMAAPDYSVLFGNLSPQDSAALVRQLEAAKQPYKLENNGATVLVDRAQVDRLRIAAAEAKLPTGGSLGYELLDRVDPLSTTSSMFQVTQLRAIEGELSRTIAAIEGIDSARVHIVMPFRELFSQESPDASASIVIKTVGGREISARTVESIRQLTSSAVRYLHPSRISIVDTLGNLLTRGDGSDENPTSTRAFERKLDYERRLRNAVERLLEQHVGLSRVRADVSVELTAASVKRVSDNYDPKTRVERSIQTVEEASDKDSSKQAPDVSVKQNIPEGQQGTSGQQQKEKSNRTEETRNFEVSRTQVTETLEAGTIQRISVAVMVDGKRPARGDSNSYEPRSADEIEQLTRLVKSVVGFNADRGDTVEVVNLPFAMPDDAGIKAPGLFDFDKHDLITLVQVAAILVIAGLILVFFVRPVMQTLLPEAKDDSQLVAIGVDVPALPATEVDEVAQLKAEIEQEMQDLQKKRQEALADMIDIDKIEGQVQASALRRIMEIFDKHPEEAAQVIRTWLGQR